MQITTTPTIEGTRVTRYCGVVGGEAIAAANLSRDLFDSRRSARR